MSEHEKSHKQSRHDSEVAHAIASAQVADVEVDPELEREFELAASEMDGSSQRELPGTLMD